MSSSLGRRVLAGVVSLSLAGAAAAPVAAETLSDAIAAAYDNNPNLQAQRASQRALDETYVQNRSGWRPTLTFQASGSYEFIRTPRSELFRLQRFSTRERGNSGAGQLAFNQPIWTGGRVAAAVTAANADVLQGRENLRRLEGQVIQAVITAYADVRRDQQAVEIRTANVEVLSGQLKENQARFDVGEVTRTDVAQAQSRYAGAQASLESAKAQLEVSRASYASVVGHNPGDLAPEPSLDYLMPGNVDDAFDVAERNSPLLRAQQFAEQASRARVAGARADRLPNVVFQSSVRWANGQIDPFIAHQYDTEETAGLTVTLPIFTGGLTSSRVRQAIERNNADRITVETQRRSVLQTITQSWNLLLAARANIVSTQEQVKAAAVAAVGTHEEQKVGLRTTIDVLNAEQELRGAQLNQASAEHDAYVAAASVLAAMGRLEARNLIPSQPQYDAAANFRRLRITWGWVPWEEPLSIVDRYLFLPPMPETHDLPREKASGQSLQQQPPATTNTPILGSDLEKPPATTAPPRR
jgi:outer membrane protein